MSRSGVCPADVRWRVAWNESEVRQRRGVRSSRGSGVNRQQKRAIRPDRDVFRSVTAMCPTIQEVVIVHIPILSSTSTSSATTIIAAAFGINLVQWTSTRKAKTSLIREYSTVYETFQNFSKRRLMTTSPAPVTILPVLPRMARDAIRWDPGRRRPAGFRLYACTYVHIPPTCSQICNYGY